MRTYLRFVHPILGIIALGMCIQCWWLLRDDGLWKLSGFGSYSLAMGLFGLSALLILGSLANALMSDRARIMESLESTEEKHDGEGTGRNEEPRTQTEPAARL